MAANWLKARRTTFGAYAAVYTLVVIVVIVTANWLADRHNKSVDTTANKRFSLSDQSQRVIRDLKQDVRITFWSRSGTFERARDLLGRYEALSPKIKVSYIDPVKEPQRARAAGVGEGGVIRVDTGGRLEQARTLTEEEVTGAIIRAIKGTERTACFLTGGGEAGLNDTGRDGFGTLKQFVERQNYKTREITLLTQPTVAKDCSVAVVARPRTDYPQQIVDALRTYVEGGGSLLLMLSPQIAVEGDAPGANAALLSLLASWGVNVSNDIILEASENAQLLGPEAPLILGYGSHPITSRMGNAATAMPLARSLDIKSTDKATAQQLYATTEGAIQGAIAGNRARVDPNTAKKGPFALAAAGTVKGADGKNTGRFVVVGSADWVSNTYLPFSANRSLFMNMLNWLSSDEDLISIRPQEPEDRRLNMSQGQLRTVAYTSLLFLPLIAIAAGIGVWWQRR